MFEGSSDDCNTGFLLNKLPFDFQVESDILCFRNSRFLHLNNPIDYHQESGPSAFGTTSSDFGSRAFFDVGGQPITCES
jgi:hypothetical protein